MFYKNYVFLTKSLLVLRNGLAVAMCFSFPSLQYINKLGDFKTMC